MRRFFWTVVSGYTSAVNSSDIEYGSAVHEFIKSMRYFPERYDLATAAALKRFDVPMTVKPQKRYMDKNHLLKTCLNYWQQYLSKDQYQTLVVNGSPLSEVKFSYPYYSDNELEVALCGTLDDISKHTHGNYALRDYKTTSVGKVDDYLSAYELSPQLLFYRMLVRYYARSYPDSIFAELEAKNLAACIEGIFLRGADKPVEYKRSEVFVFKSEQIDEFEKLVYAKIMQLVEYVKQEVLPHREGMLNGNCSTVYGSCKFFAVCKQNDEIARQGMLDRYFTKREYNPLKFGE